MFITHTFVRKMFEKSLRFIKDFFLVFVLQKEERQRRKIMKKIDLQILLHGDFDCGVICVDISLISSGANFSRA